MRASTDGAQRVAPDFMSPLSLCSSRLSLCTVRSDALLIRRSREVLHQFSSLTLLPSLPPLISSLLVFREEESAAPCSPEQVRRD